MNDTDVVDYLLDQDISSLSTSSTTNCTVAYMSDCMTQKTCRTSCRSMGASRYRWFHAHGCCQCIGHSCLHYGKSEALCLRCGLDENQLENQPDDEQENQIYHLKHFRNRQRVKELQ